MAIGAVLVVLTTYAFGSWMHGAAVAVALLIWLGIPDQEGPPVLKLAMSHQLFQSSVGLFYQSFTGRVMDIAATSSYDKTIALSLGSVAALTIGLIVGIRMMERRKDYPAYMPEEVVSFNSLLVIYAGTLALNGALMQLAGEIEAIRQPLVALSLGRLALIALLLRRMMGAGRWEMVAALLGFEVALGFTGFFSGFKEPLMLAMLMLLEVFDRRRASHIVAGSVMAVGLAVAAVMWMGVRTEFRKDFEDEAFAGSQSMRMERMQALSTDWFKESKGQLDEDIFAFVDRSWVVYYPALAVERVPAVVPHTGGELLLTSLIHITTPRIIFPNKPPLISNSELVRKYSGVWVAGDEANTSIAFGYAFESYVDFGLPWAFLPTFLFGLLAGNLFVWFLRAIAHRELAVSTVTSLFWLNMYLFEKSWSKTLGDILTMSVYVGGLVFMIDRWILMRASEQAEIDGQLAPGAVPGDAGRHA